MKQDPRDWDGSKRPFGVPCRCGAATLYMEGVEHTVYMFCEKCGYRQSLINQPLSQRDKEVALKRARELGLLK